MAEGVMNMSQWPRWARTKKKDKQGLHLCRLEWKERGGQGAKEEETK